MSDESYSAEEVAFLTFCFNLLTIMRKSPNRDWIVKSMRDIQAMYDEGAASKEVQQVLSKLPAADTDLILIAMLPDLLFEILRGHGIGTIDLQGGMIDTFVNLLSKLPRVNARLRVIGEAGKLVPWRNALERIPLLGDANDPARVYAN